MRRFRSSAPKAKNGFVAPENCFIAKAGRNNAAKNPMISIEWVNKTGVGIRRRRVSRIVHWPSRGRSLADRDHQLRGRRNDRRSTIGESADTRHVAIGRACQ
jgi:hypothetical protein